MASKIQGLTVAIGGDTTEFQKALTDAESQLKGFQSELRRVNSGLKMDPESVELLTQKSTLLTKEIEALTSKLETLKAEQDQVNTGFDRAGNAIPEEAIRKYNTEVGHTEAYINKLNDELDSNNTKLGEVKGGTQEAGDAMEEAGKSASTFGDTLAASLASKAITSGLNLIVDGLKKVASAAADYINTGIENTKLMEENVGRLQQVMSNTMDATREDAESMVALADAYERVGVVSTEVQTAALQELATYAEKQSTLETLLPVMNDMVAQQYGFNATQESATSIATMLGKVMEGQTTALSRYGYSFTEAQAAVLQFGTEEERAAVLADVVSASVGGMNEALGQTDEGNIIRLNASLGETQDAIGEIALNAQNTLQQELLPLLDELGAGVLDFLQENEEGIQSAIGTAAEVITNLAEIFRSVFDEIGDFLADNEDKINEFRDAIGTAFEWIATNVAPKVEKFASEVTTAVQSILTRVSPILDKIVELVQVVLANIAAWWEQYGGAIMSFVTSVMKQIQNVIETVLDIIGGLFDVVLGAISGDWERVFNGISSIATTIMNSIKNAIRNAVNVVISILNALITTVNGLLTKIGATTIPEIELWVDTTEAELAEEAVEELADTTRGAGRRITAAMGDSQDAIGDTGDATNELTFDVEELGAQYQKAADSAKSSGSKATTASEKVSDAIQDEIDQLDKLRENGDITYQDLIDSLENMLASYSLNAKEREKIEEELADAYSALLDDEISQLEKLQKAGKLTYKELALALEGMLTTHKMTAAERVSLEEQVAEAQLSYIGEVQDATVEAANLVSQALQNRYQDEYDARTTAINDNLTAISDAAYDEYTITYNGSTDKISLYSTEYREKIRLIDEATGAAIDGLNEEILKELELLGIKTDGYEDEIAAQQKIIDDNAAARAQEKIDDEDKQYRKQKAALEEQIANAETAEARKKLQDQLATLEENYDKTLRERKRKAEDEEAAENIKRINEEAQAEIDAGLKVIDELQKAQDAKIAALEDSQNSELDAAKDTLDDQLANTDKEAAALITTSEESQQAALAVLEEYYPEWREAGKTMVDYITEGLQENQGDFVDELDTTGVLAMEGFIDGLESQRDAVVLQARSLAQAFMDEFNSVLDINSPSREASWSGQMFGQGFTTGIENSVGTVLKAAQNLGLTAISGLNSASAAAPAFGLNGAGGVTNNDYSSHFTIDKYYQNTDVDSQILAEEFAAWQRIQMSGKGAR